MGWSLDSNTNIWTKIYPGKGAGVVYKDALGGGYYWRMFLDTGEASYVGLMSGSKPTLQEAEDEVDEAFDLIERFS